MDNIRNFIDRVERVNTYYNAIDNLPPTYTVGRECGFPQFIPDPISKQEIRKRIDEANEAEKAITNRNHK